MEENENQRPAGEGAEDAESIFGSPAYSPISRTVYSPEMKLALCREYLEAGPSLSRSEFARAKGIPAGTFDGWYWKYMGYKRGSVREAKKSGAALAPIDVSDSLAQAAPAERGRVSLRIAGIEVACGPEALAALLEALGVRGCTR